MLQLTTILFLIAGSLLAVIHTIALELYLYWKFWWFDIPMHFLGGTVIALLIFTLYDLRRIIPRTFLVKTKVLAVVFLVAVAWEVYELAIGIPMQSDYLLDTATDLVMGIFGGYIGYLVAVSINKLS